jgi:hypothetical protein
MVWVIVLSSWAAAAVLLAVLFAAVGRSGLREDQALGYTGPEIPSAPVQHAVPGDGADLAAAEVVTNSVSR